MAKVTEFEIGGRMVPVAKPLFTEEFCELVELVELRETLLKKHKDKPDEGRLVAEEFGKTGRMLRLIRSIGKDCLVRGGNTPDEAEAILQPLFENDDMSSLMVAAGVA